MSKKIYTQFKDLPIHTKFITPDGSTFIKIGNTSEYFLHYPLNERPTNAINIKNSHECVIGIYVKCTPIT